MPALRSTAAILAVACTVLLAPAAGHARKSPSPMIDKINEVREAHGISPVRYSRSLHRSSSRFARYLAGTRQFGHGSPIWASRHFSRLGEILALVKGEKIRRGETLSSWMYSSSHRAVVLNPAYRYVGAGWRRGHFGATAVVWTAHFGR